MNLQTALQILQNVNSVCPSCNGTGVIKIQGNTLPCKNCNGKGYHTFEELLSEIKEPKSKSRRKR